MWIKHQIKYDLYSERWGLCMTCGGLTRETNRCPCMWPESPAPATDPVTSECSLCLERWEEISSGVKSSHPSSVEDSLHAHEVEDSEDHRQHTQTYKRMDIRSRVIAPLKTSSPCLTHVISRDPDKLWSFSSMRSAATRLAVFLELPVPDEWNHIYSHQNPHEQTHNSVTSQLSYPSPPALLNDR